MKTGKGNYEAGYGRPPKHSRFKKGKSGNPKGRKKGTRNFNTDLAEVLAARMTITENGKKRKVSAQQAVLLRLREKALLGDARALVQFLSLASQYSEERAAQSDERNLSGAEGDILERYAQGLLAKAGRVKDTLDQEDDEDDDEDQK